ncbi:hypothetical protein Hsc_2134 [Herbaspirillum seropedicae]|nr:hypothetical protein Hsc_2134 [Herbaspirillum seropedicae]
MRRRRLEREVGRKSTIIRPEGAAQKRSRGFAAKTAPALPWQPLAVDHQAEIKRYQA